MASQQLLVFLLLLAVGLANKAAAAEPELLDDWLAASLQDATTTAAAAEVETMRTCMLEAADGNCRCIVSSPSGACLRFYVETTFAACSPAPASQKTTVLSGMQCTFTEDYFTEAIELSGSQKIGVFSAVCNAQQQGGGKFASLMVQGDIMRMPRIAFSSYPVAPAQDNACKAAPEGPLSGKSDFSNTGGNSKRSDSAPAAAAGETGYWVGSGDVYRGVALVSSGRHASKYDRGQFQLVYLRELESGPAVKVVPAGLVAAQPYGLSLELYRDAASKAART